jgi:hypothetical protein
MPGTINWNASYGLGGPQPKAEIYDMQGGLVRSETIPCVPPINCPFPWQNVQFDRYKAAITSGSNRFYYVEGQSEVSVPNQWSGASVIELSQQNRSADVTIIVPGNDET